MSAENIVPDKSTCDDISSDDVEDKKFVSQAVAFVIGHARNGFVSLCASVATLLKDQARLKQEVESLQTEISHLNQRICTVDVHENFARKKQCKLLKNPSICRSKSKANQKSITVSDYKKSTLKVKVPKEIPYRCISGCICNQCIDNCNQSAMTVPLSNGAKVIIQGEMCGIIRYIGHIDEVKFPEIFAGVELSEAVGDSDGNIGNKTYFSVTNGYGIFVPLSHILCILR